MIRLYVNEIELDVSEEVYFPITYQQSDAKEPNKTKRSASKTIKLPGTRVNNNFFMSAYNLALSDVYGDGTGFDFDPTLRYPVLVTRNGKPIFQGVGNLIRVMKNGGVNTFDFVIYSNVVDIMQALGDRLVSELGWSDYDHTLSVANIVASWSAGTGSGYVYPYVYYGYEPDPLAIKTNQLFPWIYEKEIIEKCLGVGGFTLDSSFFNLTKQKKVIWGWGGGDPVGINSSEAAARHVEYIGDGVGGNPWTKTVQGLPIPPPFGGYTKFETSGPALISDSSVMEMTLVDDPSSQYTEQFGELIVSNTGDYRMKVQGTFPISYAFGVALAGEEYNIQFKCRIFKNFAVVSEQEINITDTSSGSQVLNVDNQVDLNCDSGDLITADFYINTQGTQAAQVSLTSLTVEVDFDNTILFELDALDTTIVDGDTVNVSRFLPKMKASDFIIDTILQYNLYVSDPDENGEITMLPLDDYFYDTDDVDVWSDKMDRDSPIEIEPASKIEGKTYAFRWAEDRDYYKKLYFDQYGIDYGDYNYEVPSTFKKGVKEYQLKCAMSVPVQVENTDIVVPFIIKRNETTGVASPHKGKPRKLFYNGLIATTDGWDLINSDTGAVSAQSNVPQAHHLDSLTAPSNDLCWNPPKIIYYTATAYTTNGLFNAFHERFVREITGRDSKIMNAWFRLNEDDFYENFMRRICIIDGVAYRKNVVKDWISNTNKLVKVELIKLLEGRSRGYYQIIKETPPDGITPNTGWGGFPSDPIGGDQKTKSFQDYYDVDPSGGDVRITLDGDNPSIGVGWTAEIKNVTGGRNKVVVDATGGAGGGTIDGETEIWITGKNDSVTFYYQGDGNWKIV